MNDPHRENGAAPGTKNRALSLILTILTVILIVLSIVFIVYGLIPRERVPVSDKPLQGGSISCASTIEAYKGDILVIDYTVYGKDVAFYLTYDELWGEGNNDYIEKIDYASSDHIEIEVKNSGFYWVNFEAYEPSSPETFSVDLSYKVMSRYSPLHIVLGVASLVMAIILIIVSHWVKKRPSKQERDYIRL